MHLLDRLHVQTSHRRGVHDHAGGGQASLDDPIENTSRNGQPQAARRQEASITIKQLLTHSSGMSEPLPREQVIAAPWPN